LVGLEKQPGFKLGAGFLNRLAMGIVIGDTLMRVTYRTRPYEKVKGSVNELYDKWTKKCNDLVQSGNLLDYKGVIK